MGSISVAIELRDDFTNMLYQMAESVNFRISDSGSLPSLPTVDVRIHPVLPDPVIPQQAPVRIPVQWQSGGPEVFGGSGMERYRQEVQSTDAMLARLSHMQNSIARQAYNTSIFPPEGFRDLNRMAVRMDLVRERIQQMENHPLNAGTDAANAELERLRGQLDQALREQQNLNQAMNDMNVQEANEAYLRLQQIIGDTERQIRDHADEQGRMNSEGGGDTGRSGGMTEKITEVLSSVVTVENISEVLNLSDQMTSAAAGLNYAIFRTRRRCRRHRSCRTWYTSPVNGRGGRIRQWREQFPIWGVQPAMLLEARKKSLRSRSRSAGSFSLPEWILRKVTAPWSRWRR